MCDPYYLDLLMMLTFKAFGLWLGAVCLFKTLQAIKREVFDT